ncbi:putative N-acetyltransferase YitH [Trichinella spiralis]
MECLNEVAKVDKHDAEFIRLQLVSTSLNHIDQDFGIRLAPSETFSAMPTFSRASSHLAHVRRRYSSRAGSQYNKR